MRQSSVDNEDVEVDRVRRAAAGADAIAVFTAATDAFAERNIGMSVDRSLEAFGPLIADA